MEFNFAPAEPLMEEKPQIRQPTSQCQRCGDTHLNKDLWITKIGGRLLCDKCLIETNQKHARTYYYYSPYCVKCGEKIRGNHRHAQPQPSVI